MNDAEIGRGSERRNSSSRRSGPKGRRLLIDLTPPAARAGEVAVLCATGCPAREGDEIARLAADAPSMCRSMTTG